MQQFVRVQHHTPSAEGKWIVSTSTISGTATRAAKHEREQWQQWLLMHVVQLALRKSSKTLNEGGVVYNSICVLLLVQAACMPTTATGKQSADAAAACIGSALSSVAAILDACSMQLATDNSTQLTYSSINVLERAGITVHCLHSGWYGTTSKARCQIKCPMQWINQVQKRSHSF